MKLLSLIILTLVVLGACNKSHEDYSTKTWKLGKLTAHDPSTEAANTKWANEIHYVTANEDFQRMKLIFEFHTETDGISANQYSLDLFEIYKRNPVFFIQSVYKFYPQNPPSVIGHWINEVGDFQLEDIIKVVKPHMHKPLVQQFTKDVINFNKTFLEGIKENKSEK